MKSTNQLFILIAGITLLLGSNAYCQITDGLLTITLNVDTNNVKRSNLDTTCNFGQADTIANKDYLSVIKLGDSIVWQGLSSVAGSTDIVNIKRIKHDRGTKVFGGKDLYGKKTANEKNDKVHGKPQNVTQPNKDYKYKIKFTVYDSDGNKKGEYQIDPKLQVNPR